MTLDDLLAREAIRDTLARYTMAGDRLRIEDFVACFTEDGVIQSDHVPDDMAFFYQGHEAIRAWQSRWRDGPAQASVHQASVHQAGWVRHHLTTCQIDITGPGTARVRTYWSAWTDIGPDHAGHYLDDFRQVAGHWRIAWRRVRLDWQAPNSLFHGAVANSK